MIYENDSRVGFHRGALYEFRPIFWLEPPLWILRNTNWSKPRRTTIYRFPEEISDAFRLSQTDHQEDVVARAKVRTVAIWSRSKHAQSPGLKDVVVLPFYTVDPVRHSPKFLDDLKSHRNPRLHHLPVDPNFPDIPECYVDFQEVRPLRKEFLRDGRLNISFTNVMLQAIMQRYRAYLA